MVISIIVDISQMNMEELIRNVGEKKVTRLLKQIMENNVMLLNLQKKMGKCGKRKSRKEEEREREKKKERG